MLNRAYITIGADARKDLDAATIFYVKCARGQDYCDTGFISRACIKHMENLMPSAGRTKGVVLMNLVLKAPVKSIILASLLFCVIAIISFILGYLTTCIKLNNKKIYEL